MDTNVTPITGVPLHAREYALVGRADGSVSIKLCYMGTTLLISEGVTIAIIDPMLDRPEGRFRVYCYGPSTPKTFSTLRKCIDFINQEIVKHGY